MPSVQIRNVTAEYTRFEAWAYETFTAPALSEWLAKNLLGDLLEPIPKNGRVLDVGCGGGQFTLALSDRRRDLETHALDLSAHLVDRARPRFERRNQDVFLTRSDALKLPYPPGSFDLVVSVGSIKHWPDQKQGLEECLRVLKDSGVLHVLEADPGVSWTEARRFVSTLNFPRGLQLPFLPYFKYVVAGNGPTQSAITGLLSDLNTTRVDILPLTEVPLLHTKATK